MKKMPTNKERPNLSPGQWRRPGREGVGAVYGPNTLFMHDEKGKAELGENGPDAPKGSTYEFGNFGFGNGGPAYVRCVRTRQWFELDWQALISLAIDNGISRDYGPTENGDAPADTPTAIEIQSAEFEAVARLAQNFRDLPPIVDDGYPEARHYYESSVRALIRAFQNNGRIPK